MSRNLLKSQAIEENDRIDLDNYIDLRKFPPKLRKLAKHMITSDTPMTIQAACTAINVNYESIRSMIYKSKQNGNDFNEFVKEQASMILQAGKAEVYKALQIGAVSGSSTSHNDRKTYLQLTGDLKEAALPVNTTALTIGINIMNLSAQDQEREKGAIDTTPFIPNTGQ